MQDDIIKKLEKDFRASQKILNAIGDETRQHLLCMMIRSINHPRRVIELAEQTNLSRPAVSHHMQILKDAGLVKTRKKGTYIYYYLDPEKSEIERLLALSQNILAAMGRYS